MKNVTKSMFCNEPYIKSCIKKVHELFSTEEVLKK